MKIKLAILDSDEIYLSRMVSIFGTKYAEKFEMYSFTDQQIALQNAQTNRIDVLVASDCFDVDVTKLPKRCGFAYFVESADVETIREQRAICKFQKADLIYKQILSIYSEHAGSESSLKLEDDSTRVILFSSPSGGVGNSSVAAACAVHFASQNKKTLYLNLEKLGTSDPVFRGEGQFDMSDIIYALKSKKANLALKLESCVKQDPSGVYFYSESNVALDMLELTTEDVICLLSELRLTGSYDYIIVDRDFGLSKDDLKISREAHALVWTGDGTELSNAKISRAYNVLSILEQNAEVPLAEKLCLVYNKFSNKISTTVSDLNIKNIGGAPVYVHADTKQVVEQLARIDMYDHIF